MVKYTKEELENSKRIFKSATPKHTLDWYVKWVASCFVLCAMSLRGIEGLHMYDLRILYSRYYIVAMGINPMARSSSHYSKWCWNATIIKKYIFYNKWLTNQTNCDIIYIMNIFYTK